MKTSKIIKNSLIILSIVLNIIFLNLFTDMRQKNDDFLQYSVLNITHATDIMLNNLNKELFQSKKIYSNESEDRRFVMEQLEEAYGLLWTSYIVSSEWKRVNSNFSMDLFYLSVYMASFRKYFKTHYGSVDKKHLLTFEEILNSDLSVSCSSFYERSKRTISLRKKPDKSIIYTFKNLEDKCKEAIKSLSAEK